MREVCTTSFNLQLIYDLVKVAAQELYVPILVTMYHHMTLELLAHCTG